MCDTLSELRRDVSRYVGVFDADLLSAAQAAEAVEASTAIERMIGIVKAKAAARVSDTRGWKGAGERSAASHLARRTGSTVGQANGTLKTGQRLKDLPVLDAAARSGELSAQQTAATADAATADPSAEERLVEKAKDILVRWALSRMPVGQRLRPRERSWLAGGGGDKRLSYGGAFCRSCRDIHRMAEPGPFGNVKIAAGICLPKDYLVNRNVSSWSNAQTKYPYEDGKVWEAINNLGVKGLRTRQP